MQQKLIIIGYLYFTFIKKNKNNVRLVRSFFEILWLQNRESFKVVKLLHVTQTKNKIKALSIER